jgi:hypothetical protein
VIKATLKRIWEMHDGSKNPDASKVTVLPGEYDLERIPNPHGHPGNWLVLAGTKIGMSEGAWTRWIGFGDASPNIQNYGIGIDLESYEIVLKEDDKLIPPQD